MRLDIGYILTPKDLPAQDHSTHRNATCDFAILLQGQGLG